MDRNLGGLQEMMLSHCPIFAVPLQKSRSEPLFSKWDSKGCPTLEKGQVRGGVPLSPLKGCPMSGTGTPVTVWAPAR